MYWNWKLQMSIFFLFFQNVKQHVATQVAQTVYFHSKLLEILFMVAHMTWNLNIPFINPKKHGHGVQQAIMQMVHSRICIGELVKQNVKKMVSWYLFRNFLSILCSSLFNNRMILKFESWWEISKKNIMCSMFTSIVL